MFVGNIVHTEWWDRVETWDMQQHNRIQQNLKILLKTMIAGKINSYPVHKTPTFLGLGEVIGR